MCYDLYQDASTKVEYHLPVLISLAQGWFFIESMFDGLSKEHEVEVREGNETC